MGSQSLLHYTHPLSVLLLAQVFSSTVKEEGQIHCKCSVKHHKSFALESFHDVITQLHLLTILPEVALLNHSTVTVKSPHKQCLDNDTYF